MPIMHCDEDGKPGFKYGDGGKCYVYTPGSEDSRVRALDLAKAQGRAVEVSKQLDQHIPEAQRALMDDHTPRLMVALWIPDDIRRQLEMQTQQQVKDMHCTLAYLGKQEVSPERLRVIHNCVREVCAEFGPIYGSICGVGRFNAGPNSMGMDVLWAGYDAPVLPALRQRLVEKLEAAGVEVPAKHGYIPHITLAYVPLDGADVTLPGVDTMPFAIHELSICIERERLLVPLEGQRVDKMLELPNDLAMALDLMGFSAIAKSDDQPEWVRQVAILKADEERRLVYGVVLEPDLVDAHDESMSEEDIEKTAHYWMAVKGVMGDRHRGFAEAIPVESFIAPVDFDLGGQRVKRGSWVVGSYVASDEIWSKIKSGEYTGYSVGGFGNKRPL